jgi:DNA-binding transcriptional LysR family regulator
MDLNELLPLLPSLAALLGERNVTRAAAKPGVSQPRMSARLALLRELLDDPLLVPAIRGRGMASTPRAETLYNRLAAALNGLEAALAVRNHVRDRKLQLGLLRRERRSCRKAMRWARRRRSKRVLINARTTSISSVTLGDGMALFHGWKIRRVSRRKSALYRRPGEDRIAASSFQARLQRRATW